MAREKGTPKKYVAGSKPDEEQEEVLSDATHAEIEAGQGQGEELGDAGQAEIQANQAEREGNATPRRRSVRLQKAEIESAKGENSSRGKRKAEGQHPDAVKTPPKRRNANMKIAGASNENFSSPYSFRSKRAIPCFRDVSLDLKEMAHTVGKRVKVLKAGTKKWVTGLIESYNAKKKDHKVVLDNGNILELDMTKEQFELEVKPGEKYKLKEPSSGKGKNVKVEDVEKKSPGLSNKKDKGKAVATEDTKARKKNYGPTEKIIKLGEPKPRPLMMRASNFREYFTDSSDSSKDGGGAEVISKKKAGRKGRKK